MQTNKNKKNDHENSLNLAFQNPLASLLTGVRFLTIIPVSWKSEEDGRFFQASLIWFPFIGLLIGAVTALLVSLFVTLLPSTLTAVLAMALLAGISGCLHLDGLADSGDGLLCGRPRESALEIMRDSRTGAMGVIALVFLFLGKYAALSTLSPTSLICSVLLMPIAGRTAILLTMAILPYARSGEGLGKLFYSSESRKAAVAGLIFCTFISLFFSFKIACSVLVAILATVGFFSLWCHKKLGGATGDTLGAVCELTELAVAVSIVLVTFQTSVGS